MGFFVCWIGFDFINRLLEFGRLKILLNYERVVKFLVFLQLTGTADIRTLF